MRHVSVPYYESLSLDRIAELLNTIDNDVHRYLPDKQEIHKVSREWICNVCASVLKTTFTDWIRAQIEKRNEELTEKKDLNIELDADVAAAFRASTAVSSKC